MVHFSWLVSLHSLSLLPSSGRDIFFIHFYLYIYIFFLHYFYTFFLHKLHNLPQIVCPTLVFLSFSVFILTYFLHIFKPYLGILFYCSSLASLLRKSEPLFVSLTRLILCFATDLSFFLASIPLGFAWIGFFVWVMAISNC